MRVVPHAAAALVGGMVGLAAVAVHRTSVLGLPVGLVLGVLTTFAVAWSLRLVPELRRLPLAFAGGWLVPFLAAVTGRREGDFAVGSDTVGYALVGTAFALVAVAVIWSFSAQDSSSRRPRT